MGYHRDRTTAKIRRYRQTFHHIFYDNTNIYCLLDVISIPLAALKAFFICSDNLSVLAYERQTYMTPGSSEIATKTVYLLPDLSSLKDDPSRKPWAQ